MSTTVCIDCLPNMQPADVTAKAVPLVKQIRAARPETPIILVEDRRFTNDWITPEKFDFHTRNHAALRAAHEQLLAEGVNGNRFFAVGGRTQDSNHPHKPQGKRHFPHQAANNPAHSKTPPLMLSLDCWKLSLPGPLCHRMSALQY
jgi:hypothetical protein